MKPSYAMQLNLLFRSQGNPGSAARLSNLDYKINGIKGRGKTCHNFCFHYICPVSGE